MITILHALELQAIIDRAKATVAIGERDQCPHCEMKLPIWVPEGHVASCWCRSKGCGGRWVTIDKRLVVD